MKVNAKLADTLAAKITDNRDQPEWEQDLWEELQWIDDLDTKQVDILFGMIVSRWDKAKRNAQHNGHPFIARIQFHPGA